MSGPLCSASIIGGLFKHVSLTGAVQLMRILQGYALLAIRCRHVSAHGCEACLSHDKSAQLFNMICWAKESRDRLPRGSDSK